MVKGRVFDVQRFSVHDGPGIRTTIFFKGCQLRCAWCCNPESFSKNLQLGYFIDKCIGCGKCIAICPNDSIKIQNGVKTFKKEACERCKNKPCVLECNANALRIFGWDVSVDELMPIIAKDEKFYANSGGGVTVSGGEPLMQSEFIRDLFMECKMQGYHTAIETNCSCNWEDFERVKDYTDLFLCDIKHLDNEKLRKYTGGNAFKVMDNIKSLCKATNDIIIRVPVIPDFNDDIKTIASICEILHRLGISIIHLLPYHALGRNKYEKLFLKYTLMGMQPPCAEKMDELKNICSKFGLKVQIGG
jgi:pyruvate formate lyase activating enzyme